MAQTDGAFFTQRAAGMPPVRYQKNDDGSLTSNIESASGDGRWFTVRNEGGVWKVTFHPHLPDGCAVELDTERRSVPVLEA